MKLAYILIRDVKCCEHIGKQFGSFFTKLSIHFVLGFHHCDKIPEINNLRGERFILAHGVRDYHHLSPLLLGSCVGKMNVMAGSCGGAKCLTS